MKKNNTNRSCSYIGRVKTQDLVYGKTGFASHIGGRLWLFKPHDQDVKLTIERQNLYFGPPDLEQPA